MFARISKRYLSVGARRLQQQAAKEVSSVKETVTIDNKHGTFATFAEYRQAIIKRDPATMETRNNIMATHEKVLDEPDGEKVLDDDFNNLAKKVAY